MPRVALAAVLALFGCSSSPSANEPADTGVGDAAESRTICLLTDIPGDFDDRSYVATAFRGVQEAKTKYGWRVQTLVATEANEAAFGKGIDSLATQSCTLLVGIAAFYGAELARKAQQYTTQKFVSLDYAPNPSLPNVWGQTYSVSQATFLAGYVAAAVTTTKKVGVLGGLNLPPIQTFLDGFWLGVKHYNDKHGASVEVLGWDINNRTTGAFIGSFTDVEAAKTKANELLAAGADILFPVAGGASYGVGDAVIIKGSALVIGVDVDWGTQKTYEAVALTSVLKRLDVSIDNSIEAVQNGTFAGVTHTGTLQTGDVDIAPFHLLESRVPAAIRTELEGIRAQIIAGTLKTTP